MTVDYEEIDNFTSNDNSNESFLGSSCDKYETIINRAIKNYIPEHV